VEEDFDLEGSDGTEELEFQKLRKSKLMIAIQGFRSKRSTRRDADEETSVVRPTETEDAKSSPESVDFNGRKFRKGECYDYSESTNRCQINAIVGILEFLPGDQVKCVLIVHFEETILGKEDGDDGFKADYIPATHVQVDENVPPLSLANFDQKSRDVKTIPSLVYEPQDSTSRNWRKFGYFQDKRTTKRCGRREDFRVLDLFAGCGGMHLGYKYAGLTTVKAVDNNKWAIDTLTSNCSVPVFQGDVPEYLRYLEKHPTALGRVPCVHASPPCQQFSSANIGNRGNTDETNQLSMTIVDVVRIDQPIVAVFENVLGMWRRQHIRYLKNIMKEIFRLGYQVRCDVLRACDYGDPQNRQRFFIIATHPSAPPPVFPPKTHGDGPDLLPFVTVKDALTGLEAHHPNMEGVSTSLRPGQHGVVRLDPDGLAPTVMASKTPPFHFEEDRCIYVREAAALQSFPNDYKFSGPLRQQYQQVGNAVPVAMATAVAQSVRQVLLYKYEGE
jgi:DNA (cytosine-5)-methyltransferase 1